MSAKSRISNEIGRWPAVATVALAVILAIAFGGRPAAAQCDTWQPLGSGFDNGGRSVLQYQTELVVGGPFITAGGQFAVCIARWNGSTWQPLGSGLNAQVLALAIYNNELIAGGQFTTAGGQPASYIARWNGSTWQTLGTGMNDIVTALVVYNGELIAGGSFTTAGGQAANHVARWNGSAWAPLGGGLNSTVLTLLPYGGGLVAGGQFNGGNINFISRWDGAAWQPFGNGTNGSVRALLIYNNELVAGGEFTVAGGMSTIDGILASRVAAWDGSGWHTFGAGANFPVYAMTLYDGAPVIGGSFTAAGGQSAFRVARWTGTGWQAFGTGMNGVVYALGTWNGNLIAAGDFTTAGGQAANNVARWLGCASAVDEESPIPGPDVALRGVRVPGSGGAFELVAPSGATAQLTLHDAGGRLVGYWRGTVAAGDGRLLPLEAIAGHSLSEGIYFGRAEVTIGARTLLGRARVLHVR